MKYKPWFRKSWVWIISFVVIIFPVLINEAFKLNSGYSTLWDASNALSYYGSFIGAAGTIVLGIVAWQQNKRIFQIEENSFIGSNACIGFVNKVVINDIKQQACSFSLHDEQIVSTIKDISSISDYSSYSIQVNMQMKENIAVLVKINEIILTAQNKEKQQIPLFFSSVDNKYSRTAICHEGIIFDITMLVSLKEKNELISILRNNYSQLFLDVDFTLLTDKFVSSNLKCRSSLLCEDYSSDEDIYNKFQVDNKIEPKCFWYGNRVLEKNNIDIK